MLAALAAASGCNEELPPLEGTASLRVTLRTPAETGSAGERLDDAAREVVLDVAALDFDGNVDTGFSGRVDVYAHFLSSLTPALDDEPLAVIDLEDGEASGVALSLPPVYGPTFLWLEHASGDAPTYATGTSPLLWYRDPFLADISRPIDEDALDALSRSPLEQKQINVTGSRHGERGRLVVTGSYAQGYTVSDVACADAAGTPPCTAGDYDHIFVFTFSRPEDESGRSIPAGKRVTRLTGAVSEFNGLTEIGFPQTFVAADAPALDAIPEPVVIDPDWLTSRIELERVEAALVAIDNATVCELDDDFDTYAQWKLDLGAGCGRPVNVITAGQVPDFVPADHVGEVLPRVVGTLRPVNIGTFNVWIVYPRSLGDIQLPSL